MGMCASSEKVIFVLSWQPKKAINDPSPSAQAWNGYLYVLLSDVWKSLGYLKYAHKQPSNCMDKNLAMKSVRPAANTRARGSETCQLDVLQCSRSLKPHSKWMNANIFPWTVSLRDPLRFCSSLNGFSCASLHFGNNSYFLFWRDEYPSLCVIVYLPVFSACRRDDSSLTAIWEA